MTTQARLSRSPLWTASLIAFITMFITMFILDARGGWAQAPAGFSDVVIFATNSVHVDKSSSIIGDIVVNTASSGPTLDPDAELSIDKAGTVVEGDLKADGIKLDKNVTIVGDLFVNDLNDNGAAFRDVFSFDSPVFNTLPAFQTAAPRPGASDVSVPDSGFTELPAGDYGDIRVEKNGTLLFSGGRYSVQSISSESDSRLAFAAPSAVLIEGKFSLEKNASVGAQQGSGLTASQVIFYVNGVNGQTGSLGDSPKAAEFALKNNVSANFYVPNGTLQIGEDTVAEGAFLAKDVNVDKNVEITLNSAFANQPPVADPQAVSTSGQFSIDIVLTGFDPEGGDLSFAIETAAMQGTVSDPVPIVPAPVGLCMISGDRCTSDADCQSGGPGDTCNLGAGPPPPSTSAIVTYTTSQTDPEDSFTFKVTDPEGLMGTAVVQINPLDPSPSPPNLAAVEANDNSAETTIGTPIDITLGAGAPETVSSLTFSIESLPAGALTDSAGNVIETVPFDLLSPTVSYSPPAGSGTDGFQFAARDSSTASPPCSPPSCDTATVSIAINETFQLAEDQQVTTDMNQPIEITLNGNPGGTGTMMGALLFQAATAANSATVAGAVSDTDGNGSGDRVTSTGGRLVYLGTAATSSLHANAAADPPPNAGSLLAANAAEWAGQNPNPTIACVEDAVNNSGGENLATQVTMYLEAEGLSCAVTYRPGGVSPEIPSSDLATADFNTACGGPCQVIYVAAVTNNAFLQDLLAAAANIRDFVEAGGGLVAEANTAAQGSWTWVPFEDQIGHAERKGETVSTVLSHPVLQGLTSATLSNWDLSVRSSFSTPEAAGFTTVAEAQFFGGSVPYIIVRDGAALINASDAPQRIQIEWDISSLDTIDSATVTLTTRKGSNDSLDTMFFVGSQDQDGLITASDFEAPAEEIAGAVMPVPGGAQTGDEGTFSFDVTEELQTALSQDITFFSIQGRVDESLTGEGLQIHTTAPENVALGKEPRLEITTPDTGLVFEILSLPDPETEGTVTDQSGIVVTVGQTFTETPTVIFTPAVGFVGTTSIVYQVTEGTVVDTATVEIIVTNNDSCTIVGREANCAP